MWCIPPSAHLLPGVLFLWSTVSMLISPSPHFQFLSSPPPAASFPTFLSAVCSCLLCGMLFINLATMTVYNSRNHWHYSVFFDDIFVSRSSVCVCVREKEREAPDCAVCLCAAGLVCMKSSTSVVELVMLLCSQVGNSSTSPLCLSIYCPRAYDPCCQSLKKSSLICHVSVLLLTFF